MTRSESDLARAGVLVAGVDEAGRGPLAGPVVAAAVVLSLDGPIIGLKDSKQLSPERRQVLREEIERRALAWAVGRASAAEIDRINILQATMLAMERAVAALAVDPGHVVVDGNRCPKLHVPATAIVRGDQSVPAICAASIIAKVHRDAEMTELDRRFPGYGFSRHKGYGTAEHLAALRTLGPCPIHRVTFAPVRKAAANWGHRTGNVESPTISDR